MPRLGNLQSACGVQMWRGFSHLLFALLIAVLPLVPAAQRTQLATSSEAGMTAPRLLIIEQVQRVQLPTTSYGGASLFLLGLFIVTGCFLVTPIRRSIDLLYLPRRLRISLYQTRKLEGG
jgi:hypothetical protein